MPLKHQYSIFNIQYSIIPAFLRRDILNEISYKLSFLLQLLGIFPVVLMFFFLSRLVGSTISGPLQPYGGSYFPFVLIGLAVQNYLTLSLSRFSGSLRESQLSGTLEAVLATPVRLPSFLIGSTAYSFVFNALRIFLYLAVGSLLFDVHFNWARLPAALGVICLTIAAFSSLGIFSAGFIMLFKRGDPINWGFNVISWLLGGGVLSGQHPPPVAAEDRHYHSDDPLLRGTAADIVDRRGIRRHMGQRINLRAVGRHWAPGKPFLLQICLKSGQDAGCAGTLLKRHISA